jgi:hypothetical protein
MERALLSAIQTLIRAGVININPDFIFMWNNQHDKIANPEEDGQHLYTFTLPAIFLEIESPTDIKQLGNGVQLYDFNFRLHLIDKMVDAGDGTLDQNLEIFDIKQLVFQTIQGQAPDKFGQFCRIQEEQDQDHKNLYHFIQEYATNYTDFTMNDPIGGILTVPPTALDLTGVVIDNDPNDY